MTKADTEQCTKVLKLFEYVECTPLSEAFYTLSYWTFILSLSDSYNQFGRLTEAQYNALVKIIRDKTDCVVKDYKAIIITHEAQYTREDDGKQNSSREMVEHSYGHLEVIQLFDLPFESGSQVNLTVHAYNSHSMVIKLDGIAYKIPKPAKWDDIVGTVQKRCAYRRTACKGYLDEL